MPDQPGAANDVKAPCVLWGETCAVVDCERPCDDAESALVLKQSEWADLREIATVYLGDWDHAPMGEQTESRMRLAARIVRATT